MDDTTLYVVKICPSYSSDSPEAAHVLLATCATPLEADRFFAEYVLKNTEEWDGGFDGETPLACMLRIIGEWDKAQIKLWLSPESEE